MLHKLIGEMFSILEMIDKKREEVKEEVAAILKRGHEEEEEHVEEEGRMEVEEAGEDVMDKENHGIGKGILIL